MKNLNNNDSPTSIIHEGNFIADPLLLPMSLMTFS